MSDYLKVTFTCHSQDQIDLLVALLTNLGFDSFEERALFLDGYITPIAYSEINLEEINEMMDPKITWKEAVPMPKVNWNQAWESNYDPIIAGDVYVRAPFHESKNEEFEHEIIITPKMSFGTGHHETTQLLLAAMKRVGLNAKSKVLDFGTGTGILAIYAYKLGATNIKACDIDDWSIENAPTNFDMNKCTVDLQKGDIDLYDESFDAIFANINRHVLELFIGKMAKKLNSGGHIFLSGFYEADRTVLHPLVEANHLKLVFESSKKSQNGEELWCGDVFTK